MYEMLIGKEGAGERRRGSGIEGLRRGRERERGRKGEGGRGGGKEREEMRDSGREA